MARVLIADDSDLDRVLTQRAIRKAAPEVGLAVCEDGEGALKHLATDQEVTLVLLDHRMPRMGAEEFLEAAGHDRLATVNTILFSSAVSPAHVARCLELGAREYVEKPTDPSEYADVIAKVLRSYLA